MGFFHFLVCLVTGKSSVGETIGFEFSTDIISQNMTKDEIREKLGLPEMDTTINENTAVINAIK